MVQGPKRPSMHESMLWTNLSGFLVAFFLALVTVHRKGAEPLETTPPLSHQFAETPPCPLPPSLPVLA